jgi:hypothetical protein
MYIYIYICNWLCGTWLHRTTHVTQRSPNRGRFNICILFNWICGTWLHRTTHVTQRSPNRGRFCICLFIGLITLVSSATASLPGRRRDPSHRLSGATTSLPRRFCICLFIGLITLVSSATASLPGRRRDPSHRFSGATTSLPQWGDVITIDICRFSHVRCHTRGLTHNAPVRRIRFHVPGVVWTYRL